MRTSEMASTHAPERRLEFTQGVDNHPAKNIHGELGGWERAVKGEVTFIGELFLLGENGIQKQPHEGTTP